jgi:FlaA1/EpsC-like NDP-sugar epimerase
LDASKISHQRKKDTGLKTILNPSMTLLKVLISSIYLKLNRNAKKRVFLILDIALFLFSIYLSFGLRFDFKYTFDQLLRYRESILLIIPIKIFFFWLVGVYRPVLRYVGLEFLGTIFIAVIGGTALVVLSGLMLQFLPLPRSILIIDAIVTLISMVSLRVFVRWLIYSAVAQTDGDKKREKLIIYGAGEAGTQIRRTLASDHNFKVIAFIDDNKQLHNNVMHGVTVHSVKKLPHLIKKYDIDSILLAMPSIGKQRNREVISQIQHHGVQMKTIPGMIDIISGKVSINEIRNIDIVDLLGREEIKPDSALLKKNILDKTVLVTGAGGSIGSELCRQILENKPKKLVLYELNEFALYSLEVELRGNHPDVDIHPFLGSVLNQTRLERILSEHEVNTIYHAAAYKHVPMVELNCSEGILNNIKGTLACVRAAKESCVDTFVLISTDKAVRPSNIMGTTKRIAEMILQAHADMKRSSTRFIMVRFGNVLDSNGSVVPRFRNQLASGQNLTLTHENITRYFMSISEAARLVIQAGALGKGGEVFLLEMGEPVRIFDLANQMIELSGLKKGQDIDIDIVGLRPGEKLYEELLIEEGNAIPTIHPMIFCTNEKFTPWNKLSSILEELFEIAENSSRQNMINKLKELVPEYKCEGFPNKQ